MRRCSCDAATCANLPGGSWPAADGGNGHRAWKARQIRADRYRSRRYIDLSPRHVRALAGRSGRPRKARPFRDRDRRRPRLALNDARRFGSLDLWPTADIDAYPAFAALGPEPLGPGLTAEHLDAAFDGRIAPVKALLLDQRIVAGLGNIYVCEALFLSRISPKRAAGRSPGLGSKGWWSRFARCCARRSRRAGRRCAITRDPTANSVISPSSSTSTDGRVCRATAAAESSSAMPMAGVRPSGAPSASVDRIGVAWLWATASGAADAIPRPFSLIRPRGFSQWRTRRKPRSASAATTVAPS